MASINKPFRFALLAKDIQYTRRTHNITLVEMAAITNVPMSTCQRAEKGMISGLEMHTAIALCNFVNEPVQKYLTHENKNQNRKTTGKRSRLQSATR
jgi:DNA-binding XRE family transcriptional regulator